MTATKKAKRKTPEDGAAYAAQMIREALLMLTEHDGLETSEALAGAHAEIVSAIAMIYGAPVAAERCANAALRLAELAEDHQTPAILGRPAGHA